MTDKIKVQVFTDGGNATVHVRDGTVFIGQGQIEGDAWAGESVCFSVEHAEAVIAAIRSSIQNGA